MSHDGARWENLLQLELSENIFHGAPQCGTASTVSLYTVQGPEVSELLLNFTVSLGK